MAKQLSKLSGVLQRAAVDCRPLLTAAPYNWSSLAGSFHSSTAPTLSTAPQVAAMIHWRDLHLREDVADVLLLQGPQTHDSATSAFRSWAESRRFSSTSDAEQLPGDKGTDLALKLSEVCLICTSHDMPGLSSLHMSGSSCCHLQSLTKKSKCQLLDCRLYIR